MRKLHRFDGRLVMVGFGCIGQGVLPLLLRHIDMQPAQVLVIAPGLQACALARSQGAQALQLRLSPDNYGQVLLQNLREGDFLLNLAVDVSSVALIALCQDIRVLYLDTCIEPWAGGYTDLSLPRSHRTNHALREAALALRAGVHRAPTAVLTHGANPGLVSHLLKQALLDIAQDTGLAVRAPRNRLAWARLAQRLGVRVIHVAERDTQVPDRRKAPGEFVNTWSVEAFIDEASQPSEMGWGSHEKHFPADGVRHATGSPASIYLNRPGASTRVRTWTPLAGAQHAFLITHSEAIAIADYFTIGDGPQATYRPTVHYAYHPCDDAVLSLHELTGRELRLQDQRRVVKEDITAGIDELGVLVMGHAKGAYWFGSQLQIDDARSLCAFNSATSLQVTAAVLAGVVWAMQNPERGVVEPDEMPFQEILGICKPYLGKVLGAYTDWTPLAHRSRLFDDAVDASDPWQFQNFRVF